MTRKLFTSVVFSIVNIIIIMTISAPSYGISVSLSSGDGSGSVSSSQSYNLDDSTSLQSHAALAGSEIQQSQQVSGTGHNSVELGLKGDKYSIGCSISSSGALSTSSSSEASSNSGSLSQQLSGAGDASMALGGVQGEDRSDQRSSVTYGEIDSFQSVSIVQDVSSSQRSAISGEAGGLGSGALSSGGMMLVTGGFEGRGSMKAELQTSSSDQASAHGEVSVNGGTLIDDSTIQSVGKDRSIGLNMEGLTAAPDGSTGSFSANVVNMNKANSKSAGSGGVAAAQVQTGYKLWTVSGIPMKWTQSNPREQLYLVGSSVPGTLDPGNVQSAISTAANTWDNVVGQDLFADGSTVKIDNTKNVVPADGKSTVGVNTQGWRTLSSNENPNGNTLAITYNWFNGPSGGYYSITESDTAFNNAISWSTTGGTYDVQTVSLHELGHTIGLGHISDTNQIMNPYYTGVRHTLGSGDVAGAQYLYGISGNIANIDLQAAANGKYVCAENAGLSPLIANRNWALQWETFGLVDLGNNNVALRAVNGKYVCAENAGQLPLIANRDAIGPWETFKLIDLGNNNVALRAVNGKYVCAENAGQSPLIANRDGVLGWETFGLKYIK